MVKLNFISAELKKNYLTQTVTHSEGELLWALLYNGIDPNGFDLSTISSSEEHDEASKMGILITRCETYKNVVLQTQALGAPVPSMWSISNNTKLEIAESVLELIEYEVFIAASAVNMAVEEIPDDFSSEDPTLSELSDAMDCLRVARNFAATLV